jgi:DNA-binding NtrC family response regulator
MESGSKLDIFPDGETADHPPVPSSARLGTRISVMVFARNDVRIAELGDGDAVVVGRAPPSDLRIDDASLSRRHARFVRRGDAVSIEDLGSRNGTWIDGQRVETTKVTSDAGVLLGKVHVSVHFASAVTAAAGIESHDRWLARLEAEIVRAKSFRRALAVFMLRVRGPHAALPDLCQELRRTLRPVDVIGAYGSGAVLVLAPELAAREAAELAERLRSVTTGEARAFGVASFPEHATSAQELVSEAMQACLRATPARPVVLASSRLADAEPAAQPNPATAIHASPRMQEAFALLRRLAQRKLPVLLLGETGSGKELAAWELHTAGPRRDGPMRIVNCAAIPATLVESLFFGHERGAFTGADRARPGMFEEARGGTLLLDEVGELAPAAQAALLRVLETSKVTRVGGQREIDVDVRVVAATHRDLERMAESGAFRFDLLHRLNAVTVTMPPLRERREDIAPLVLHFLARASEEWGAHAPTIDPAALALLEKYDWPGNVRELRNVVARAVAIAETDRITVADLPERLREGHGSAARTEPPPPERGVDLRDHLRRVERDLIAGALERAQGNQRKAAELLNLPLRTFERRLAALKDDGSPDGD